MLNVATVYHLEKILACYAAEILPRDYIIIVILTSIV